MLSNNGSKTLWESLNDVAEEISALANMEAKNHKIVVQSGNEVVIKVQEVQASMDSLVANLMDFKEHYLGTIQSLADEMRKANAAIVAMKGNAGSARGSTTRISDLVDLENRVQVVEAKIDSASKQPATGMNSFRQRHSTIDADLIQQVSERLESEVGGLKRKLDNTMASSMDGQSVTFGSFTFKSPREVEALFGVDDMDDPQISHCWDLFAAFENMVS